MVALTWRNVDAPDFTGAAASQAIAGRSLNNAFSGFSESLKAFDNTQSDIVNRSIQAKLAAAQTPEDVAKLAPLITGGDPRRLSGETLTMFGNQPTTLIQRAATKRNFEWAGIDRQFSDEQKALGLKTAALMPAYQEAMGSRDPAKIQAFHAANPDFLHGMTLDATKEVLGFGNAADDRSFNRRNGELAYNKDLFSFNNSKELDANQKQAAEIIKQLRTSVVSNADFQRQVTAMNLPPEVQAMVLSSAAQVLPGAGDFADMLPSTAPGMPGSTSGLPGGAGPMAGLYAAVQQVESNNNPNAVNKKSGAQGLMQLMPETAKNPGFGITPARDNSPAENQRVGQEYLDAMFKKYNGDTKSALMAYNWGPANVDAWIAGGRKGPVPAETQAYVGKVAAAAQMPSAQADSNITNSISSAFARNNPNNFAQTYGVAARAGLDLNSAAESLITAGGGGKDGGALAGMPKSLAVEHLKTVYQMAQDANVKDMNWSIAAEIVKNSTGGNWYDRFAPNFLGGNSSSGGTTLDKTAAKAEVAKLAGNGISRAMSRNDELTRIEGSRAQVAANYSAAYTRWQQAQYSYDVLGKKNVNVQAAHDEYMKWANLYGQTQAALESDTTLNAGNTPPTQLPPPLIRDFKFNGAHGG